MDVGLPRDHRPLHTTARVPVPAVYITLRMRFLSLFIRRLTPALAKNVKELQARPSMFRRAMCGLQKLITQFRGFRAVCRSPERGIVFGIIVLLSSPLACLGAVGQAILRRGCRRSTARTLNTGVARGIPGR